MKLAEVFGKLPSRERGSSRLAGCGGQATFPCQVDREPGIMQSHWAGVRRGPLAQGGRTGRHDLLQQVWPQTRGDGDSPCVRRNVLPIQNVRAAWLHVPWPEASGRFSHLIGGAVVKRSWNGAICPL